jgi:2-(3-amino-3-carboxypropyl)histidine synthase
MNDYDLEIGRIAEKIREKKAKLVCLQLPDGLKQQAMKIASEIESKSNAKCLIWLGSCFGACDLPLQIEKLGIDLLVQFGHSSWKKAKDEWKRS